MDGAGKGRLVAEVALAGFWGSNAARRASLCEPAAPVCISGQKVRVKMASRRDRDGADLFTCML